MLIRFREAAQDFLWLTLTKAATILMNTVGSSRRSRLNVRFAPCTAAQRRDVPAKGDGSKSLLDQSRRLRSSLNAERTMAVSEAII